MSTEDHRHKRICFTENEPTIFNVEVEFIGPKEREEEAAAAALIEPKSLRGRTVIPDLDECSPQLKRTHRMAAEETDHSTAPVTSAKSKRKITRSSSAPSARRALSMLEPNDVSTITRKRSAGTVHQADQENMLNKSQSAIVRSSSRGCRELKALDAAPSSLEVESARRSLRTLVR